MIYVCANLWSVITKSANWCYPIVSIGRFTAVEEWFRPPASLYDMFMVSSLACSFLPIGLVLHVEAASETVSNQCGTVERLRTTALNDQILGYSAQAYSTYRLNQTSGELLVQQPDTGYGYLRNEDSCKLETIHYHKSSMTIVNN